MSKMSKLIVEKYFLATRTLYPGYAPHGLSISIHMDRNPCSFYTPGYMFVAIVMLNNAWMLLYVGRGYTVWLEIFED